jgi:hypothetical protein
MKKLLTLVIFAAAAPLQATLYSEADLRKIESTTAIASTAATIVRAVTPPIDVSITFIKELSGTTNKLMAYALLEQSSIMRFTRALQAVAANESWHAAPQLNAEFMKMFAREFAVAFSQSITHEIVLMLQNKVLSKVLGNMPNRIVLRIADLVSTAVTATLVDVVFNYLNDTVNGRIIEYNFYNNNDVFLRSADERVFVSRKINIDYIIDVFGKTFFKELAFHIAGEVIRQGAEDKSYVTRFLAENS